MVEDSRALRRVRLEGADALIGFFRQRGGVVVHAHELGPIVLADRVRAFRLPRIVHLLAEIQRPVEARRIVVGQLGVRHDGADAVHHGGDLLHVGLLGFDPQQVGAGLERCDAVHHAAIHAGAGAELEQVAGQALRAQQFSPTVQQHVAVAHVGGGDFFAIEVAIVLVAQIAGGVAHGDLLGQARAQRVGAGDDDAVFHAQFQERVTHRADLREEVLMRHGHFAVLMAALLFVGHLVLDLQRAGAGLDHLLGQEVGGLRVAEAGVDVGDDRHHVGLVIFDAIQQFGFTGAVAGHTSGVDIPVQAAQLTGVGLAEERIDLLDQRGDRGLLVHGLVGQGAEFGAQGGDHPAGQVDVAALGGAEVLLDSDDLLLADEAVPGAQRLGVKRGVGVVGGHVGAHDGGGVASDVQPGLEAVLQPHARHGLGVDAVPGALLGLDQRGDLGGMVVIGGRPNGRSRHTASQSVGGEIRLDHRVIPSRWIASRAPPGCRMLHPRSHDGNRAWRCKVVGKFTFKFNNL